MLSCDLVFKTAAISQSHLNYLSIHSFQIVKFLNNTTKNQKNYPIRTSGQKKIRPFFRIDLSREAFNLTQIMQFVSSMRFKSPKNSGTRASFERAGVVIITVLFNPAHAGSTRNEQVPEFKGILNRNRKALHNLGLTEVLLNPDYAVDFVHEIQNTKEDEHSRKFRARSRGHLHGEHPKRASASIRRCFGSE
jgi:hypothetical protein